MAEYMRYIDRIVGDERARITANQLPAPFDVIFASPMNPEIVMGTRKAIQDIINGKDTRKLAEIGPCGDFNLNSSLDYTQKLIELQNHKKVKNKILIVRRTHGEKPRTAEGHPGILKDPHMDGSNNLMDGLKMVRKLYLEINRLGVPCTTEILDLNMVWYFSDCIASGKIGARSVLDQEHRYVPSGMSMPIGFKNDPSGNILSAINAIKSARASHTFSGPDYDGHFSVFHTTGNPYSYLILRGGSGGPNFDQATVENTRKTLLEKFGLVNGILVDCSHDNSKKDANSPKDYKNQITVALEIARQIRDDQQGIMGISIESYIKPGNQKWKLGDTLDPEKSATDECLGWEETRDLILEFADNITV